MASVTFLVDCHPHTWPNLLAKALKGHLFICAIKIYTIIYCASHMPQHYRGLSSHLSEGGSFSALYRTTESFPRGMDHTEVKQTHQIFMLTLSLIIFFFLSKWNSTNNVYKRGAGCVEGSQRAMCIVNISKKCDCLMSTLLNISVTTESDDIFPSVVCNSCYITVKKEKEDDTNILTSTISICMGSTQ